MSKSMAWFLFDRDLRHERVNGWKPLTGIMETFAIVLGEIWIHLRKSINLLGFTCIVVYGTRIIMVIYVALSSCFITLAGLSIIMFWIASSGQLRTYSKSHCIFNFFANP